MTTSTADERFLKRILFLLVSATIIAGSLAGAATVKAGSQATNFVLFEQSGQ